MQKKERDLPQKEGEAKELGRSQEEILSLPFLLACFVSACGQSHPFPSNLQCTPRPWYWPQEL